MSIETKFVGGIGINVKHAVLRDGVPVALIERNGNRGMQILSRWYNHRLGHAPDIVSARQLALTLDYLSERGIYDVICARVANARRIALQEQFGPKIATLAQATLGGSNSARTELSELLADIETLVQDRIQSTRKQYWEELNGEPVLRNYNSCKYPNPPAREKAA